MYRKILISCRGNRTRPEVSKEFGITPQMLGMIERGERNPSFDLMKTIADFYGLTVDEIFFTQDGNKTCL